MKEKSKEEKKVEKEYFKIKTTKETLATYIHNISQFLDEATITVSKEGLRVLEADRPMICVVDLNLPEYNFSEFEVSGKEIKVRVNVELLNTIIKKAGRYEMITLEYFKEKDREEFWVKFDNTEFKVPILDYSEEEIPPIDELKFTTKLEVEKEKLQKAIEYGLIVGETLAINCDGTVSFETNGDVAKVITKLESMFDGEPARARYPLDYLRKLKLKSETIKIEFGKDYPMKLTDNHFSMILAPRVTEE